MAKTKLPSTAVGRRRLLKGAALLDADAKNAKGIKFDFSTVGCADQEKPYSCNTVGCALGLFGVSGAFKRQGLRCTFDKEDGYIRLHFGRSLGSFAAASKFFEIGINEAEWLFASADDLPYPPIGALAERIVAKRIRDFVAGRVSP